MKRMLLKILCVAIPLAFFMLPGCATISVRTQPYLGVPDYPSTDPEKVEILTLEPKRSKDRLGEIFLDVEGEPTKELIEKKLRFAVAEMGGDAAFIVSDQTHIYPVVYVDYWGSSMSQNQRRGIIAVAIKYR